MYCSTHLVSIILFALCMCIGCVAPPDRTDETIVSTNGSADAIKGGVCLNLDRVDEINNGKNAALPNASEAEEYAVYDYIIGSSDANRTLVVIYANTTSGMIHTSAALSDEINRSELFEQMPSLELETLEDYESKNKRVYPLRNLFKYNGTYVIVNESEIFDVLSVGQTKRPRDDWEEFYEKCPRSPCIKYFSRVGFNSKLDQALVEDDINCPYVLAGIGYLVLLEKRNGSWNATTAMRTWIS
jgi:hypothetical protein